MEILKGVKILLNDKMIVDLVVDEENQGVFFYPHGNELMEIGVLNICGQACPANDNPWGQCQGDIDSEFRAESGRTGRITCIFCGSLRIIS